MAFNNPIYHYSRTTQYGGAIGDADVILFGPDYSGAAFTMSLASAPGAAKLKTFANAAAGQEGISASFDPNFRHPVTGEAGSATIVRPQINAASFTGLPIATDPKLPLELYYELLMAPVGQPQRALCHGIFTLYPGIIQ